MVVAAPLAGVIVAGLKAQLIPVIGAQANALVMGIGAWRHDLTRTLMDAHIPTTGGASSALEALRSNRDTSVLDTPLGVVRDSHYAYDSRPPLPDSTGKTTDKRERGKGQAAKPPRLDSLQSPAQRPPIARAKYGSRPKRKR